MSCLIPGRTSCSIAQEQRSARAGVAAPQPILPNPSEEQGKLLGVRSAFLAWGHGLASWHRVGTDPLPAEVPACSPHLPGSIPTEPVLPGAAVANPDLGERTFLTYLTVKARAPQGHPSKQLAGKAPRCWGHPSGALQGGTSRTCRQALFQNAVLGAGRARHSSGCRALGPAGTAPSCPQHSSLSSGMARVLRLWVTPPLFGEMPTTYCTSPGSPNHRPSRALSGEESSPLAKCRPEARPCTASSAPACRTPHTSLTPGSIPRPAVTPCSTPAPPRQLVPRRRAMAPPHFAVAGSLTAGGVRCRAVPGSPPPPGLSSASPVPAPGEHKRTFASHREGPADAWTAV